MNCACTSEFPEVNPSTNTVPLSAGAAEATGHSEVGARDVHALSPGAQEVI